MHYFKGVKLCFLMFFFSVMYLFFHNLQNYKAFLFYLTENIDLKFLDQSPDIKPQTSMSQCEILA